MKDKLQDMGAFAKVIRRKGVSQQDELDRLETVYTSWHENELPLMQVFYVLIDSENKTFKQLETAPIDSTPTLVYKRDEVGEHPFVTEQPCLA